MGERRKNLTEINLTDKSTWPAGAWQIEPDFVYYQDYQTKLHCLIQRNNYGSLCGYVAIEKDHPYFGIDYNDYETVDIQVHGGLTFSGPIELPEETRIKELEGLDLWWFGFDCSHIHDLTPAYTDLMGTAIFATAIGRSDVYRNMDFVKAEIRKMVKQLDEVKENATQD